MTLDPCTRRVQLCSQRSAGATLPLAQPHRPPTGGTGAGSGYKPSVEIFTHLGSFSGRLLPRLGSSRSLTVSTQKGLGPCSGGPRAERAEPTVANPATQGQPFHGRRSMTAPGCPCAATRPHPCITPELFLPARAEPLEELKVTDAYFGGGRQHTDSSAQRTEHCLGARTDIWVHHNISGIILQLPSWDTPKLSPGSQRQPCR